MATIKLPLVYENHGHEYQTNSSVEAIENSRANNENQALHAAREKTCENAGPQGSPKETSATMTIVEDNTKKLPNELIFEIFGYITDLNAEPPSVSKFSLEPSKQLTRSSHQPLKTLSLVCQRWRNILLPDVFRHVCVTLNPRPRWLCLCASLERQIRGQRGRSRHADQVLKTIQARVEISPERAWTSKAPENAMGLEYVEDCEKDLLLLPGEFLHWLPSIRGEINNFLKFIVEKGLQSEVKSLVLQAHQELTPHLTGIEESIIMREVNILWRAFFETLSPPRLVIAAPPSTMAALTSSREGSSDTWVFELPIHYLSFSMQEPKAEHKVSSSRPGSADSTSTTDSQKSGKQRTQLCPSNLRPWTHMAYNEGTMLPAYAHYEWQWKKPPQVLPYLLYFMHRQQKCERSPNLQSFEYISIFPFAEHIESVMQSLSKFKSIRSLKVKFAEPDYLDDSARLGKGQTSDVWAEWKDCYTKVIRKFLQVAREGAVFESVDTERAELRKSVVEIFSKWAVLKRGHVPGREFMRMEGEGKGSQGEGELWKTLEKVRWVRLEDPKE
jgi:hypothetical protein